MRAKRRERRQGVVQNRAEGVVRSWPACVGQKSAGRETKWLARLVAVRVAEDAQDLEEGGGTK